jgi:hypothetical protein
MQSMAKVKKSRIEDEVRRTLMRLAVTGGGDRRQVHPRAHAGGWRVIRAAAVGRAAMAVTACNG